MIADFDSRDPNTLWIKCPLSEKNNRGQLFTPKFKFFPHNIKTNAGKTIWTPYLDSAGQNRNKKMKKISQKYPFSPLSSQINSP